MTIRVGLDSTKVLLTEVGRKWILENYPKGIVWEYDENKPWILKSMGNYSSDGKIRVNFVELLYLGIPYRLPTDIDGEITFKMMNEEASGWELAVRERGKCGSCVGSLAEGHINMVSLDKYATWEFPVWGNILARDGDKRTPRRACTLLCDKCIDLSKEGKAQIKWAIEIYQKNDVYQLRYHDIRTLEVAEPITEEDLE